MRHILRGATLVLVVSCVTLGVCNLKPAQATDIVLPGLSAPVDVYRDAYAVPHIYARTSPDAAYALGYLHASDRLWQMDMLRRRASGTTAEVIGPGGLESDILMRRLGIRRGCQELWDSSDLPADFRADLEAYAAGVNARVVELGDALPPAFQMLGYQPQDWTPVDALVFSKYMGWDQSGTDDDLWFGEMVANLGTTATDELWPMERPYEVPTVRVQAQRPEKKTAQADHSMSDSFSNASTERLALFRQARAWLQSAGWFSRSPSFGSNNWAVDGTKSASGKPIVANDPHLGFMLPSVWYTAHLSVDGRNVAGVTFPGSPNVVIGHNDRIAWGITNMQADAVDYFVETIDSADPTRYKHRGDWKKLVRTTETINVRGADPHELNIDATVHGPLIARKGEAVSLCWTGLGPTRDGLAIWKIGRAQNLNEYLAALDELVVPALSMVYGDVDGNIAIHPCGGLPLRRGGHGRIPLNGSTGDDDWVGMIPRDELPLAVNPAEHYVASANGRPHPLGFQHYLGWMWDPSYRTRRIHHLLSGASKLTLDKMAVIQNDAYDEAAARFLPTMVQAITEQDISDPVEKQARDLISQWDYVAGLESRAPAIWMRWFETYRDKVWKDEWASRGIEQPGGSWGFSGDNRREPMLEVLEAITREQPESVWFDDRSTPQREGRDEIVRQSWSDAIASLRKQLGDDTQNWVWSKLNILKLRSLAGVPDLDREGGPIVGDSFTLNPGGDIGPVGGGASWRMLVDLARPDQSLGVYPGGQSEDPASQHYTDQTPLWATGKYVPLAMHSDAKVLAKDKDTKHVRLAPAKK